MLTVIERAKVTLDRTTGLAAAVSLALALTSPPAPASAATACPDVGSAQELLAKAAARENSRALEAARGQDGQAPRKQGQEPPRDHVSAPPEAAVRAAALVKEAEAACEAGDTTAASEKAKAAMALLQKK